MECTDIIRYVTNYIKCSPCIHGVYIGTDEAGNVLMVFSLCTWSVLVEWLANNPITGVLPVYMECTDTSIPLVVNIGCSPCVHGVY